MSFAPSSSPGDLRAAVRPRDGAVVPRVSLHARRWLAAAAALFLAVKLAWVLVPAGIMGVPRLGDDALVYLWSGASSVASPRLDRPAIRDIIRLRQLDPAPPPPLEHARARVAMRTTGVTASPVALFADGLLRMGAGHRLAFALVEAAIAVALCAGIAYGVGAVAGSGAAAGALALTVFAILPNQGLHYLVPSVFDLALGLVLWATVMRHPRRWLAVVVLALAMLLAHPIGPVYLLVAAALVAGQALLDRRVTGARLASLAALAGAVPLWLGVNALLGVRAPLTTGLGGFSIAQIPANAAGLMVHVRTLVVTQPVLAVALVAGLVRAVQLRRTNPAAFLLAGVLTGVVVTTLSVDLPGYPGELPSRALIALVVVCSGLAAGWALQALAPARARHAAVAAALLVAWGTQLPTFARYAVGNIDSRHQIYDSTVLRTEVEGLPAGSAVVWADTDIALMAGLLAGADRLRAVPYPMLGKPGELRAATQEAPAVYVATTSPERLNGVSVLGSRSLVPRFYGWGFRWYRQVTIEALAGAPLPALLRIEGDPAVLTVVADGGRPCELRPEPAAGADWYRIAGCVPGTALRLEGASSPARLTGLGVRQPVASCAWPWGERNLRVLAVPRGGGETSELHFDFAFLLGEDVARDVAAQVGPLSLHGCRSGIIWLRAGTPA